MRTVGIVSIATLASVAFMVAVSCGGGGGGSDNGGYIPPAPDPTCGTAPTAQNQAKALPTGYFGRDVVVPTGTMIPANDDGTRAHTTCLIDASSMRAPTPGPVGYTPAQIRAAYGIPDNQGGGAVAIIDAYDYATALNDFNVFSTQFGLPTEISGDVTSSSNTFLQVVYASGTKPKQDPTGGSWHQEAAIDIEWVHAIAPLAKIYLVEADSNKMVDLFKAVAVAKTLPGVEQISMSFVIKENPCHFVHYDSLFVQNGITFFASSGDTGDVYQYIPSLSKNVVSVGGTSLTLKPDGTRSNETAWSLSGCGPSLFEPRPPFQDGVMSLVRGYRGASDISAVANPATGVAVYDSTMDDRGNVGWIKFGGTSVSAPLVAAMVNASRSQPASSQDLNTLLYSQVGGANIFDVTSGAAGSFAASPGWDMPTGVGSPKGLGGF